jgi:hypothetical protein
MRKENTVEDQDRLPDEELDVEGHAKDLQDAQELLKRDDEDDDFEGHALRDVQDAQDAMRGDSDVQDAL